MKQTQILSGKFSTGANAKGNFTGYNSAGEKIFIFKEQMATLGITTDVQANAQPFFALVATKEIPTRDENGELTTTMVNRLQATSVFKTRAEIIAAVNADALLALEAAGQLKAAATTAGLTESSLNAILDLA